MTFHPIMHLVKEQREKWGGRPSSVFTTCVRTYNMNEDFMAKHVYFLSNILGKDMWTWQRKNPNGFSKN